MNRDWRWAIGLVLLAQALFWSSYALIATSLQPTGIAAPRTVGGVLIRVGEGPRMAALVSGLAHPAELRLSGWQPVVVEPARAALLTPAADAGQETPSVTCLTPGCEPGGDIVLGDAARVIGVARWERLVRFDVPRTTATIAIVLGLALLALLPVSRFSRLQMVTGLFLLLVAADAYLSGFGQSDLTPTGFALLRYTVQYGPLAVAAMLLNALAGWRAREARFAALLWLAGSMTVVALWATGWLVPVVPWIDAAALTILAAYGVVTLGRLLKVAPGSAARTMALLLVGIASVMWDVVHNATPSVTMLNASNLSPVLLMIGIVVELAIQGHRLNQAADGARSDLARQLSEQDAHLLQSSTLLRYQERRIAVDAERQRLVRDMHDGIGATLTHLLLDVRGGRIGGEELAGGLRAALDDLRNIAGAIDGSDGPVDLALAAFCERMAPRLERAGIAFDYRCALPVSAPVLDAPRLLSLHRLLQEAVGNALRHGRADRVALTLAEADGALVVTVEDDGCGFDPAGAGGAPGEGRGLGNMRRRADQMGGTLAIDSAPGRGTCITLQVPQRNDRRPPRR